MSVDDLRCITPFRDATLQVITERVRTLSNLLEDSAYNALLFVFACLRIEVEISVMY